jgi:hypothetical protein
VWYVERQLFRVTLGDLLILVLIRTIQHNIATVRDKYLHTNCLAALANMSANFRQLHQYVAQRIVDLFKLLSKRHEKMAEMMRRASEQPDPTQDYVCILEMSPQLRVLIYLCLSFQSLSFLTLCIHPCLSVCLLTDG